MQLVYCDDPLTGPVASLKYKYVKGRDHVCCMFGSVPGPVSVLHTQLSLLAATRERLLAGTHRPPFVGVPLFSAGIDFP